MGTKLEVFLFKLGRRYDMFKGEEVPLWHIVSPDNATGRLDQKFWRGFIDNLRTCFKNRLHFNLYPNQPVYEYRCENEDLRKVIKQYLESKVSCEVVFENFDYDKNNMTTEVAQVPTQPPTQPDIPL
jgi:hypothetical protein